MMGTDDPRTSITPESVTKITLIDWVGVDDLELQEMKFWIQQVNSGIDETGNICTEIGALTQRVNDLEETSSSVEGIRTLSITLPTSMRALQTRVGEWEDLRPTESAIKGADQQRTGD